MALEPYGIGGLEMRGETFETSADIPQNRVLIAEKLTSADTLKPVIVDGLTNIGQVFNHFSPQQEVFFETEYGIPRRETLRFNSLEDFSVNGITEQSTFLIELRLKELQYQKIIKQLQTNQPLREALKSQETKAHLLELINQLTEEL